LKQPLAELHIAWVAVAVEGKLTARATISLLVTVVVLAAILLHRHLAIPLKAMRAIRVLLELVAAVADQLNHYLLQCLWPVLVVVLVVLDE
jgi:hypothetical protein